MRVKILDKFWELEFGRVNSDQAGLCDPPDKKGKKMIIRPSLRGERCLEIVLHETLHAADYYKDEEWVAEVAEQQARIICRKDVLERVLDDSRLLERVAHILAKHGYTKE